MELISIFPTTIGYYNNQQFSNAVLPIAEEILKGREKNYLNHTNTYRDSEVSDYLNKHKFITDFIYSISHEYTKQTGWILPKETSIGCFVSNMEKGDNMISHLHPRSILSGICYLKVNQDSSPIFFQDSRDQRLFTGMVSEGEMDENKYTPYNTTEYGIRPKNGDILVWESWIRHSVKTNKSDYRTTLVWNLSTKQEWN